MQINRLFEMVYLLLHRKKMTTKELAEHFEVSQRTVLRDVETLSSAGLPIYTTRGRGGGVALMDHFVLNKAALTDKDQEQILLALENLSVTESTGAEETLGKLRAFFARDAAPWIEVDFTQWGGDGMEREKFDLLKRAVVEGESLGFSYYNNMGEFSQREVFPLKLIFKSRAWYLSAYCLDKQNYRLFKINRMRDVSLTEKRFQREDYPVPAVNATSTPSQQAFLNIQLRFDESVAYRLYDEFGAEDIRRGQEGLEVTMVMRMDNWVLGYLLSFGDKVEVIGPASLRSALREQAKCIQKKYEN